MSAVATDTNSSLSVAGEAALSGTVNRSVNVSEGENTIPISVTAADGTSTQYEVTVARAYPNGEVEVQGSGNYDFVCTTGYAGDGETCLDIDECAWATDSCTGTQICTNTPGSYICTNP